MLTLPPRHSIEQRRSPLFALRAMRLLSIALLLAALGQVPAWADAPIANPDSYSTNEDTPFTTLNVLNNDTDPDGDVLSVTDFDTTGTIGQVADNGDGTFDYDPDGQFEYLSVDQPAEDTFSYTVSDGNDGTATATVTITIKGRNDAPTAGDDEGTGFEADEDTILTTANVLDNDLDPDTGDSLSVIRIDTSGTVGQVTDNRDGTFDYDPDGQFEHLRPGQTAQDTFTYTVGDGNGGTAWATVRITVQGVNDDPIALDDIDNTDEDTGRDMDAPGVLVNDTDPERHSLQVNDYDVTSTQGAIVVVNDDGSYSYDPTGATDLQALPVGGSVVDTFDYTIDDGNGGTSTATVHMTVRGINDPPTAYDDQGAGYTTDEDTPFITDNVLGNDLDPDRDDDLSVIAVDSTGMLGQLTNNGDGTFDYDPNGQFETLGIGDQVIESFTYTVSDEQERTATATVYITVNGVNDAPLATDNAFLVQEDTTNNLLDPLVDDSDVEGDSLTIVSATLPMSGTIEIAGGGIALAYTPDPDFYGYDSFSYTINDVNDGSATATITIQVENVNDDPVAEGDSVEISEDSEANILYVLANDTYLPDPFEILTITGTTPATHGVVNIAPDWSSLSYVPEPDYYGPDVFTYTVIDGNGGSTDAEVTITVLNVNDDPQAIVDSVTISEDSVNVIINVLDNDTYLPDPVETLTIVQRTNGSHGSATVVDGDHLLYTPVEDYYGPDELTYTIDDGNGGTATGTVEITVQNVNDRPTALRDAAEVDEDSGPNRIDVLDNDTYLPDPPETLTVVGYTSAQHGTMAIVDQGASLTYQPEEDYYGTDSFAYTISDGNGGYHTASIDVTVLGINDRPIAENDPATTQEDTPVVVDVLDNDSDIDGNLVPLTVRVISGPSHGSTSVISKTGQITYTPELNWNGIDIFTYRVCDNGTPLPSKCDTALVDISVGSVNDPPISDAGPDQRVDTNAYVTLDGSGSSDPDNDYPLTYLWSQTGEPKVTLNSTNAKRPTFSAPNIPCVLTFTLQVIDSEGQADITPDETVVTVLNQPPVADAGPDQTKMLNSFVTLDGSGSYDPDSGYSPTYLWSQTGGPKVTLSSKTAEKPTFIAPSEPTVLTFALSVADIFDKSDPTPDEVVITVKTFYVYMPVSAKQYASAPDLVIRSITARSNSVELVIANQGNAPVRNDFWVDVYIAPRVAPTVVNQPWYELGDEGLVWGVFGQALSALKPGGTLTLKTGDLYYFANYSKASWPLSAGTPIYGQVDSFASSGYGAVSELDEILGRPYNNVYGPVASTAGAAAETTSFDKAPRPAALGNLPPRP